ncbi:MAG: PEP-CTERM sorting domain-containing protein [Verrucomicrobiaceae bacterium]
MKSVCSLLFCGLGILVLASTSVRGAVTLAHYQNAADIGAAGSQAAFLSEAGSAVTTGGVSIGYFLNNTAPTLAQVQALSSNPSTAYSQLVSLYNYIDLRNVSGAALQSVTGQTGGFDWDFGGINSGNLYDISGQISANVSTVGSASATNLVVGTRFYVLGFNAGSFLNGFTGSTEWAFVGESGTTGTIPSDNGSRNIRIGSMDGAEVWVGTDVAGTGANVRMVSGVPEPSRALLGMIGLGALFIRRRR